MSASGKATFFEYRLAVSTLHPSTPRSSQLEDSVSWSAKTGSRMYLQLDCRLVDGLPYNW